MDRGATRGAVDWPSPWLLVRGRRLADLAVLAAFGILLAVLSRGTSLAIGVGILYSPRSAFVKLGAWMVVEPRRVGLAQRPKREPTA